MMCECKLILSAFFVCHVIISSVTCFNIDQVNYAVYGSQSRSMFGFTVAVHKDRLNRGWVLVGAPEAQSGYQNPGVVVRGGAVYKCSAEGDDRCQEIAFDRQNNVFSGSNTWDEKSGRWFGATLSTSGQTNGPVVACAPRYLWFTKDLNRRDPVGTCYVSNGAFDNFEEYSPCRTMNWGYHRQGSCQAGFSAAINKIGDRLYVGAPGSYFWQGQMYSVDAHATFNYTPGYFGSPGYGAKGSVHQQSLETRPAVFSTREGEEKDDDSYIGYSTVVGHFKENEEYEGIAVGMPRGNKLKGKVLLFTWNLKNYKNITVSQQIGSYFGYSIAAADINGDKKLDLIVGAPMHTESNTEDKYDVGRVYVLYQSSNFLESYNVSHHIDGFSTKGRFGHSVASLGDLNQDGFDDFAIGAPYDSPGGRGAVYIYYGSAEGIRKKYGQVIYAEDIQIGRGFLSTFGFSVTGGMDLDGNEYPDMAVGAYLSDAAFFFRSRPVVRVDGFVRFQTVRKQIDIKEKNCKLSNGQEGTCTAIDFCIRYSGKGIPQEIDLLVRYVLDSKKPNAPRMGFLERGSSTFNETLRLYKDNREFCKTQQVYVKNEIRDKLTPLEAEVQYFMVDHNQNSFDQLRNPRSQLKPVLDLNNPPSKKDAISIQKNCGSDNICIPNLLVDVTSSVDKYLLGSDKDLEFDVIVSNLGEDSFETTFEIKYPERIFYRKTESEPNMPVILCSPSENRTVTCDIGNPLPSGKIAAFKMLFQPHKAEGMAPSYEFDVFVNSTNPESEATMLDNHKHISIGIWIDASLEPRGESYPSTVHYNESLYTATNITREGEIGPQVTHVYYLTNRGPATVQEAEIFLLWPLTTLGDEDLLYLLDQPHTQGNVKCDAALSNYKHYELDYHKATIWDRLKIDISGVETPANAEGLTGGKTTEMGGGISSGVGVFNVNENVNISSGDSSQVFEARHNVSNVNTFGNINANGEYEYTEARYITTLENGAPVTRWENVTTVKDASGKILRTFYSNDNSQSSSGQSFGKAGGTGFDLGNINVNGEYVHTEVRYTTTYENGIPTTKKHNITTIRDANGNILRTFNSADETEQGSIQLNGSSSFDESRRITVTMKPKIVDTGRGRVDSSSEFSVSGSRSGFRTQEEIRRQEEERRQAEIRARQEEEIRYGFSTSGGIRSQEEMHRQEEKRRQEEIRIRQEEEIRRQQEERRRAEIRARQEQERIRSGYSVTGGSISQEEIRRQEEQRRQEEITAQQREERRRDDIRRQENERRLQLERAKQEQERIQAEEQRRQAEIRRRGEEERIRLEEIRLQREKEIRIAEEKRRQQAAGQQTVYEDTRQSKIYQQRPGATSEEELRRRYEEQRRIYEQEMRARTDSSYQLGGGVREGGSGHYDGRTGQRVQTGYFDEQGVYHDLLKNSTGGIVYNRTYTYESSTSVPIDISGGSSQGVKHNFGEVGAGDGFTVHTFDLGQTAAGYGQSGRSESAAGHSQSSGSTSGHSAEGYRREWKTEGSFSGSGRLPPVIIHNSLDGDNVPANSEPVDSRHRARGKREILRDPYKEMQALVKCNSTNCIYIRCVVGVLEKNKEIAIALRSRLNVRAIKDLTSDQPIKVSSMMIAKISKLPYVGDVTEQVYRKHEIFTDIPAKEAELVREVAPLWIYVVSAVAGIVMLLLLIWLLSKCGFFKRNRPSPSPERQPLNRNGYHSGDEAL